MSASRTKAFRSGNDIARSPRSAAFLLSCALGLTLLLAPAAGDAAPGEARAERPTAVAAIPFDPPLGRPLRFRYERTVEKDGVARTSWSIDDYRFEKTGEGYRLTISPVASGNTETEPATVAAYKKLEALSRRPILLTLDETAQITGFEGADAYWKAVFDAMEEALAETAASDKPMPAETRTFLKRFFDGMRAMPAEARLALLLESIQPVVQFASTQWSAADPVSGSEDVTSPFGGTMKRDVRIALTGADDETASLSVHATIPRSELEKATRRAMEELAAAASLPATSAEIRQGIGGIRSLSYAAAASFEVSMSDGLVRRHQSTETVEVRSDEKTDRRVTSVSLHRVE